MTRTQRLFRRLFWITLAGIVYGSLYPFKFVWHAPSVHEFWAFLSGWLGDLSKADVLGNVLLFMPSGYLGALGWPKSTERSTFGLKWFLYLVAFATVLQIIQFWLPYRVPEIRDVVWNALGLGAGWAITQVPAHRRFMQNVVARHWHPFSFLLLIAWFAYKLFPYVPSLDWQNIKDSLKPLFIYPQFRWEGLLHDTVAWLVVGYLVREVWHSRRLLWLIAAGTLAAQVLVVHHYITVHHVLALIIAFGFWSLSPAPRTWTGGLILSLLSLQIVASGLLPWHLSHQAQFGWIPFSGFLQGSMTINVLSLFEKCFFYGALIYLLAEQGLSRRWVLWWPILVTTSVELGQIYLIGKTAEITDPILCGLLFLGFYPLHHRAKTATPAGKR